jgi:hypothetical protein
MTDVSYLLLWDIHGLKAVGGAGKSGTLYLSLSRFPTVAEAYRGECGDVRGSWGEMG